jgi:hypothetical protein
MTRQPAYGSYTRQRARCSFVPPFVIDHLAMDDREEVQAAALATAHQAMDSRARRAGQELTIARPPERCSTASTGG